MDGDRHSKSISVPIIRDRKKRARREARNALRQIDLASDLIHDWLRPGRRFHLTPSPILLLHKAALEGLDLFAGTFRNSPVKISRSKHVPPAAHLIPSLVQEMCDYVNKNRRRKAIHLCAYVMWRMNWIHPFADGNGRTARAVAHFVLCVRLGYELPGILSIPEQIAANKKPYYKALEAADRAFKSRRVNVDTMETLLSGMLAKQLLNVHKAAMGNRKSPKKPRRLH